MFLLPNNFTSMLVKIAESIELVESMFSRKKARGSGGERGAWPCAKEDLWQLYRPSCRDGEQARSAWIAKFAETFCNCDIVAPNQNCYRQIHGYGFLQLKTQIWTSKLFILKKLWLAWCGSGDDAKSYHWFQNNTSV